LKKAKKMEKKTTECGKGRIPAKYLIEKKRAGLRGKRGRPREKLAISRGAPLAIMEKSKKTGQLLRPKDQENEKRGKWRYE